MQEINSTSQKATESPVSNAKGGAVRWHSLSNKNAHSPVYESVRAYRRHTAAYWLNNARKCFKLSKKLDSRNDDAFLRMARKEMLLYAKWKAKAERADW